MGIKMKYFKFVKAYTFLFDWKKTDFNNRSCIERIITGAKYPWWAHKN